MKRHLLLLFAMLMATLSLSAATKTWSFEWNKKKNDAGAQGFYNFGSSFVEKTFYEAELNGVTWDIKSDGTMTYAYTASMGQTLAQLHQFPTTPSSGQAAYQARSKPCA